MTVWKDTIIRRFDAAAGTYDGVAGTQNLIAAGLARRILALPLAGQPDVLEIGCGTGALTAILGPLLPGCRWLATDIAPAMVAACARRALPGVTPRVMDGECPDLAEASFDLIVSNMAVQWFDDLPAGLTRLHRLLKPGGMLAVTTLGAGTFAEWRTVCHEAGVEPGTPAYLSAGELAAALPESCVAGEACPLDCGNLKGFLDHLRLTGARAAHPGHPGLSPGVLKRMLRAQDATPFSATYDVLTVHWKKET